MQGNRNRLQLTGALVRRAGKVVVLCSCLLSIMVGPVVAANLDGKMTDEMATQLGEKFGIVVGPVDEDIQKELKLQKAEGVVVFEVIGGTPAELAGIKVRVVIKEIDKVEVRTMADFGRALKQVMATCNYTVGTYEPADPENQGVGGVLNFHFVPCVKD
jgi:membrane-associated protease RseP (regulator of RpoE activity)